MRLMMVGSRVTTGRIIVTGIFFQFLYDLADDVVISELRWRHD